MIYEVLEIKEKEQLNECPIFRIRNYQWRSIYQPEAFGRMALLPGKGLLVSMTTMEGNPLKTYTQENDPVYKDSAMELFLNLKPDHPELGYLNFEINANGAMLSGFGPKGKRVRLNTITEQHASCRAEIEADRWTVMLWIPMELICEVCDIRPLAKGDGFTFNFYKISQNPEIEHYGSLGVIDSPQSDFHTPQFFVPAIIN